MTLVASTSLTPLTSPPASTLWIDDPQTLTSALEPLRDWPRPSTDVYFNSTFAPRWNCTPRIVGLDPGQPRFGALDNWLALVAMIPGPSLLLKTATDLTPPKAIELLRAWTGMPVSGLADLLGVARRSVYHWSAGSVKPRQGARLLGVVRALEPLSKAWQAWEFREWLSTGTARGLVQSASIEEINRQVEDAVKGSKPSRLRLAAVGLRQEILPLDSTAIDSHLSSVLQERTPRPRLHQFEPRELTDTPLPEEE